MFFWLGGAKGLSFLVNLFVVWHLGKSWLEGEDDLSEEFMCLKKLPSRAWILCVFPWWPMFLLMGLYCTVTSSLCFLKTSWPFYEVGAGPPPRRMKRYADVTLRSV